MFGYDALFTAFVKNYVVVGGRLLENTKCYIFRFLFVDIN